MVSNFESIVPNLPSIVPSPLHDRRFMLLSKEPLDSSQAGFRKTGNLGSVSVDEREGYEATSAGSVWREKSHVHEGDGGESD